MTSMMLRRCLTAVALAALAAVVALAPVSSAEATPSVSPFAGTYDWNSWPVPITISDVGRITGSNSSADSREKVSISGRVSDDGSYSFTVSETFYADNPRPRGPAYHTNRYEYAGNMALDDVGNIVGTSDSSYGSFVWLRQ